MSWWSDYKAAELQEYRRTVRQSFSEANTSLAEANNLLSWIGGEVGASRDSASADTEKLNESVGQVNGWLARLVPVSERDLPEIARSLDSIRITQEQFLPDIADSLSAAEGHQRELVRLVSHPDATRAEALELEGSYALGQAKRSRNHKDTVRWYGLAVDRYQSAIALFPFNGALHHNLGISLAGLSRLSEAAAAFADSAFYGTSFPRSERAFLILLASTTYSAAGSTPEAIEILERYLAEFADCPEFYLALASMGKVSYIRPLLERWPELAAQARVLNADAWEAAEEVSADLCSGPQGLLARHDALVAVFDAIPTSTEIPELAKLMLEPVEVHTSPGVEALVLALETYPKNQGRLRAIHEAVAPYEEARRRRQERARKLHKDAQRRYESAIGAPLAAEAEAQRLRGILSQLLGIDLDDSTIESFPGLARNKFVRAVRLRWPDGRPPFSHVTSLSEAADVVHDFARRIPSCQLREELDQFAERCARPRLGPPRREAMVIGRGRVATFVDTKTAMPHWLENDQALSNICDRLDSLIENSERLIATLHKSLPTLRTEATRARENGPPREIVNAESRIDVERIAKACRQPLPTPQSRLLPRPVKARTARAPRR